MSKIIMGISVEQIRESATKVQQVLTEYGCFIKTRLGLHNASDNMEFCSEKGLIILEFILDVGDKVLEIEKELMDIKGVTVRKMEF